jgi:hypothetical protein
MFEAAPVSRHTVQVKNKAYKNRRHLPHRSENYPDSSDPISVPPKSRFA